MKLFRQCILLTNRKWKLDPWRNEKTLACWSFSSTRTWLQADWRDTRARKYQQRLRGVATKRSGSGGWFCGSRQWWGRSLIGGILGGSFVDEGIYTTTRRRWTLEKGFTPIRTQRSPSSSINDDDESDSFFSFFFFSTSNKYRYQFRLMF